MNNARIAVVGGSLGGLTAACLLRDDGHDVTVYERSPRELEQRGAGIGFLETSYRYLVERAGLALGDVSIATDHIRYLARDGSIASDAEHRYLFSSWNMVYRQLLEHWGSERYLLGHEMGTFEQSNALVEARFTRRIGERTEEHSVEVDLLVCADGVGSASRRTLQPDAGESYAGYVAWRGMVPESEIPTELAAALTDAITYYVYANSHILVYPIPGLDGSVEPGQRLINFVWYRNYLAGGDVDDLLTDRNGERRDLSIPPGFAAAHHVAEMKATAAARLPPQLAELVERTAQPFVQVVYDIDVDRMAFDRVCLLGDAAFSARPHAAAGTAKAADDGWALAAALSAADDVPTALAAWEPLQLEVGRNLLERTRRIGRRSQVENSWEPGDPDFIFGLYEPGR